MKANIVILDLLGKTLKEVFQKIKDLYLPENWIFDSLAYSDYHESGEFNVLIDPEIKDLIEQFNEDLFYDLDGLDPRIPIHLEKTEDHYKVFLYGEINYEKLNEILENFSDQLRLEFNVDVLQGNNWIDISEYKDYLDLESFNIILGYE